MLPSARGFDSTFSLGPHSPARPAPRFQARTLALVLALLAVHTACFVASVTLIGGLNKCIDEVSRRVMPRVTRRGVRPACRI
jgi:hypothetical protein